MASSPTFAFKKRTVKSLKDVAYETIKDAILTGDLHPGDRLVESDVAKQMGISRGPIREAFQHLEKDGLLLSFPYKETVVAELSVEEANNVYVPIRRIVENYACSRAADKLSQEDFTHLEGLVEGIERSAEEQDLLMLTKLDSEFHQYIITKCASPTLLSIWDSLSTQIYARILTQNNYKAKLTYVAQEHYDLLHAMRAGDRAAIAVLMETHIA